MFLALLTTHYDNKQCRMRVSNFDLWILLYRLYLDTSNKVLVDYKQHSICNGQYLSQILVVYSLVNYIL